MQTETQVFDQVLINDNHGSILLRDATWTPYPLGREHYNPRGDNGFLVGTVIKGCETSRLFFSTSTKQFTPGITMRIDYASLSKMRKGDVPQFDLYTCG